MRRYIAGTVLKGTIALVGMKKGIQSNDRKNINVKRRIPHWHEKGPSI